MWFFSHYNWICVLFPLCHWFSGDLFTAVILKLSWVIIHHVLDYACCNCVIINTALFYPQKCPIWVIHFVVPEDIISLSSFHMPHDLLLFRNPMFDYRKQLTFFCVGSLSIMSISHVWFSSKTLMAWWRIQPRDSECEEREHVETMSTARRRAVAWWIPREDMAFLITMNV